MASLNSDIFTYFLGGISKAVFLLILTIQFCEAFIKKKCYIFCIGV